MKHGEEMDEVKGYLWKPLSILSEQVRDSIDYDSLYQLDDTGLVGKVTSLVCDKAILKEVIRRLKEELEEMTIDRDNWRESSNKHQ